MDRKITKIETVTPMPTRKRMVAYARVSSGKDEMLFYIFYPLHLLILGIIKLYM